MVIVLGDQLIEDDPPRKHGHLFDRFCSIRRLKPVAPVSIGSCIPLVVLRFFSHGKRTAIKDFSVAAFRGSSSCTRNRQRGRKTSLLEITWVLFKDTRPVLL